MVVAVAAEEVSVIEEVSVTEEALVIEVDEEVDVADLVDEVCHNSSLPAEDEANLAL